MMPKGEKIAVQFWGARGFNGSRTACVSLATKKRLFVCDAGTGIYFLGKKIAQSKIPITILLSHYHWDHIFGIPDFKPLHQKGREVVIAGPAGGAHSVRQTIANVMCDPYFPFTPKVWKADVRWYNIRRKKFRLNGVVMSAYKTHHRNKAQAYQFFFSGGTRIVYATDHELQSADRGFARWIHGCDLLIHDAQYDKKSYPAYRGWGHSAFEDVLHLALRERVKRLVLFHHPPDATDRELEKRLQWCHKEIRRKNGKLQCNIAIEGKSIIV